MRESALENDLYIGVIVKGGECMKWSSPGRRGVPDRIVMMPGAKLVYVETKTKGGKLHSWQKRCHERLRELGFRVEVIWTPEQVNEFLCSL